MAVPIESAGLSAFAHRILTRFIQVFSARVNWAFKEGYSGEFVEVQAHDG